MKFFRPLILLLLLQTPLFALAGQAELTWYGHAAFKLTTPPRKVFLIYPSLFPAC